ncbi:hypothetical protein COT47_05285 [Candidatus Woesearchaeota archaeon CG08_land_8_20_14_0_20_43_7]|nr:MAG: hypothetical protein COT47_05285 [Candidatus Woesearchaeota archaeon CG08_land_8_20_14_0_20_43_7]
MEEIASNGKRGRPHGSNIRQNMINLLFYMQAAHGYELYKVYSSIFPRVSQRVIYYHLKRGVQLDEFQVEKIQSESGNFSWGNQAEKIYYSLGPSANPRENERIEHFLKVREMKI